mmetsp:Transcript_134555/g.268560  ORF Transcript_134555/g.268560 Transcript_134555/m.268560 type:complete len:250 (+) Transcript_134555:2163-2912(+)
MRETGGERLLLSDILRLLLRLRLLCRWRGATCCPLQRRFAVRLQVELGDLAETLLKLCPRLQLRLACRFFAFFAVRDLSLALCFSPCFAFFPVPTFFLTVLFFALVGSSLLLTTSPSASSSCGESEGFNDFCFGRAAVGNDASFGFAADVSVSTFAGCLPSSCGAVAAGPAGLDVLAAAATAPLFKSTPSDGHLAVSSSPVVSRPNSAMLGGCNDLGASPMYTLKQNRVTVAFLIFIGRMTSEPLGSGV